VHIRLHALAFAGILELGLNSLRKEAQKFASFLVLVRNSVDEKSSLVMADE
jgi:hypothetical protein